jgi:hypothetical protein
VVSDPKQIIEQIETYIYQGGGEYEDWYIGLTGNPIDPVTEAFSLHKVQGQRLAYFETTSSQIAQAVADYFVNLCGADGNLGTNEISCACKSLYVYKKATHLVG